MDMLFLTAAGQALFSRSDAESAHWVQHELSLTAEFPFDPAKVIQRGQRVAFRDPATDELEVFEIRQIETMDPGHSQQITAEHIAVSELQDEHIDKAEITDETAAAALATALTGTLWSVGTDTSSGTSSANISRGSVWQAVGVIKDNWNVYITPRVVISAAGAITGRYLDISPAGGVWRGMRLSIRKNMLDPSVTYNDENVLTALYGYGGTKKNTEINFSDVEWQATADHPAKPKGQTYLEWPEKTALYGRNGRPRFGYYQNSSITDPNVLLQKTWESLKQTCEPKISIAGTCVDLSRLGYNDEPLRLHDLAVVEIEETGELYRKEIIMLDVDLIDPSENQVEIGDYIPNIIYINRETNKRASGGGGGGNRGEPNEESETFAEFAKTNEMIGMVVGTRNGGYYVKAGEIVLAINADGGTNIKLHADTIDIDGIVTSLAAKNIGVGGLNVEGLAYFHRNVDFEANITVENKITCYGFEVDEGSFNVFGNNATWQSKEVVTAVERASINLTPPYTFTDTGGTNRTGQMVDRFNRGSVTTGTIYYLGRVQS